MRLRDVDYFTWVSYDGQPGLIRETFSCYKELLHSNRDISRIRDDKDVEILEVPKFNVGEMVVYVGHMEQYKSKTFIVTEVNDEIKYRPYTLDNVLWVAPFEIKKVEY